MWFLWAIGVFGVLSLYSGIREPLAYIMTAVPIVWFGGKALLSHTKNEINRNISKKEMRKSGERI